MTPLSLLKEVRSPLGAAIALQTLAAVAGVLLFVALADLAEQLPHGAAAIWPPLVLGAIAVLAATLLTSAATTLSHLADTRLQLRLRQRLADRIGRLPLGWFATQGAGRVAKVVRDDVHGLHHLVAHTLLDVTAVVVTPLAALGFLIAADPWLALVSVLPLVVGVALFARSLAGSAAQFTEYGTAQREINAGVVEFVNGIAVVKTYGGGQRAHRRFADATAVFHDFFRAWAGRTTTITTSAFLAVSAPAVLVVVLGVGIWLVDSQISSPADLLTAALLAPPMAAPLAAIGTWMQQLRAGVSAAESVTALLAEPELPQPQAPRIPDGSVVRLENVAFSYDGETEVLRGIDLELRPGTVTALVGPSGAGKSTVALLVARFHDVTRGRITLGGVDVRELSTETLFQHIGFVFQDAMLLRMSVADNIRLGRPSATDAQVHAAARAARVHDRIVEDPRGYDAIVGVDVDFSGGERQRIAIARAVLADTPVLVLDEATAFADPESEELIQDALSELARGRTLLVVAHRLRTIVDADQIVVLSEGQIVHKGRHGDLLAEPGRYARMWQAQEGSHT
ncbi:ABC transporter ATP-binding protein/permease [Kibdelosporangium philippinense]|uniref:ABC transporter ATP-binding protein/permease n=1 Tax=Kibdelosporangium philippinense TaxID=211113 RepID=A0ABS8ZLF6_9PSEU|nr:ABC transporter ATP-binding protein [Kibdelosporangium philippinense]MCE7007293.1 ABC transporter ATP-binding protein/permease [Kibdelosporangium philippinense]